jgi:hypothetical protein
MKTIYEVLEIISLICKMVLMIYSGWKFFGGDKEKNSTLYYGILFVATLV